MAPVFDNNRSLLFDMDDDQLKNTDGALAHALMKSLLFSAISCYTANNNRSTYITSGTI